jgi:hypothetical protein
MSQKTINFITCNLASECAACTFREEVANQPIILCSSPVTAGTGELLVFQNKCTYRGTFSVNIDVPEEKSAA